MIKRPIRNLLSNERGMTIVLVALMLAVLLGFAAMAVDVGDLLWNRRGLQNAVDAAALAAVQELPKKLGEDYQDAVTIAEQYVAANMPDESVKVTVTVGQRFDQSSWSTQYYNSVVVTATRTRPPLLRSVLGVGDIDVSASAEAVVSAVLTECYYWPWAVEENAVVYNEEGTPQREFWRTYGVPFTLKVPPRKEYRSNDPDAPYGGGNFGALSLCPADDPDCNNGAPAYEDVIERKGCVEDGQVAPQTGDMKGPTKWGVLLDNDDKGVDSALLQCVPNYPAPKNIQGNETLNYVPEPCVYPGTSAEDPAHGLGCSNPSYGGDPCGHCLGPGEPIKVDANSCGRLGYIAIVPEGSFSSKADEFPVIETAVFYLLGLVGTGDQPVVVGYFLAGVEDEGQLNPNAPPTGLITRVLWR